MTAKAVDLAVSFLAWPGDITVDELMEFAVFFAKEIVKEAGADSRESAKRKEERKLNHE